MTRTALCTDFYELTMMQGYFVTQNNPRVVFDMFYRTNPFNGGYVIFAGLEELINKIQSFFFSKEDINYLSSLHRFSPEFIEYLRNFSFKGDIYAMEEGTVVFPGEPLIRVESTLMEAQIIEGMLLNTINFQSLIATKASRLFQATAQGQIMEFGLRRAQGPDGALSASRAAYIGGCSATSNTLAGKVFGIPVAGTMAHSWVMAFENELEAFRQFSSLYPDNCILLIDTYDTLGSGIENAILVGKELQQKGKPLGVRIDSGDLSYLSREIRKKLDHAGLHNARIYVSNDLTEEIIETLIHDKVPIDSWGVGTHLVTGGIQSSLNGVYKLSAKEGLDGSVIPTMKVSNSFEKATNPGKKQVYRFFDEENSALGDLITLEDEYIDPTIDQIFYHPFNEADFFTMKKSRYHTIRPMLQLQMKEGKRCSKQRTLTEIRSFAQSSIESFHSSYRRMINPHIYKVSLSDTLKKLKTHLALEGKRKLGKD